MGSLLFAPATGTGCVAPCGYFRVTVLAGRRTAALAAIPCPAHQLQDLPLGSRQPVVESGLHSFEELFPADQKLEESVFMGDSTFRYYLRGLSEPRQALLRTGNGGFEITAFGRQVLQEKEDCVRANGINRWLGGVHLCEGAPVWRWDEATQSIRP